MNVLYIFPFTDHNQNSYGKFTNIFVMQVVDHEGKIYYVWPYIYI